MANNNVSSLLNVDIPKPKTSNFNLGRVNRLSADVAWCIPCYTEEILPNSYKRLDVDAFIQTNATVAPLMGSFKVSIDAFFVPLRLYYKHLDLNNIRPNFSDDFAFHYIPTPSQTNTLTYSTFVDNPLNHYGMIANSSRITLASHSYLRNNRYYPDPSTTEDSIGQKLIVAPSSLIDYLGLMPVGFSDTQFNDSINLNATPFIGYFDIWRNYYSNPHDTEVPFRVINVDTRTAIRPENYTDVYIPLDTFDKFIYDIVDKSLAYTNSLDASPLEPQAVNVMSVFNQHFNVYSQNSFVHPVDRSQRDFFNIPLFSGQLFTLPTTADVNDDFRRFADTRNGMHFGLLPRTYMDDYFNSRFRNDFVTYMEEESRVKIENNTFTIAQLRVANRVAKYVDKSIFSDTRFGSWIKAHFGVKTNQKLNIPQFLGSIKSNIVFNDIYSSAQTGDGDITSNQALGSRASLGQGFIKNKGSFVEFRATEPGYLMCILSIQPYVSYFQGIKKMYLKNTFYDLYRPEFDAIGYDDLQKIELCAINHFSSNYTNTVGTSIQLSDYNTSVGKHPAWLEYMTSFDESHGLMTQRYQYGFWTLNRPFNTNAYDELDSNDPYDKSSFDASTYIRPEHFNHIFAVDKFTDNFQVQLRFYDKTKQPISKQILPHL